MDAKFPLKQIVLILGMFTIALSSFPGLPILRKPPAQS
jgi:hypothetical protein